MGEEPITDMIFLWKSPNVVFWILVNNKGTNNGNITCKNDFKVIFGEMSVWHIW